MKKINKTTIRKIQTLFFIVCFLLSALMKIGYTATLDAPDFTLKDIKGQDVTLSDFKGKEKVLLFFWATWCFHCRRALKELSNKEVDYKIITINIGESKDRVESFLKRNGYDVLALLDKDNNVAVSYSIFAVPTFIVIGKDSKVEYIDNIFPASLK